MARGDLPVSPWVWDSNDYASLKIQITVNYNDATKVLTNAVVHRDSGCQYTKIVFDVPSDAKSKRLAAPADGQPDRTYTAAQMAAQGLNTIDDILAVQITAEP